MFSKAERFQQQVPDTSGVGTYNVQSSHGDCGCLLSKASRFENWTHASMSQFQTLSSSRCNKDLEGREEPQASPLSKCISPNSASLPIIPEIRRYDIDKDGTIQPCQTRLNSLQNQLQESEEVQKALKQQLLLVENECIESKSLNQSNYEALCAMTGECLSVEEELNHETRLFKESVAVLEKEIQLCHTSISKRDQEIQAVREFYECAVKGASKKESELIAVHAKARALENKLAIAEDALTRRLKEYELLRLKGPTAAVHKEVKNELSETGGSLSLLLDLESQLPSTQVASHGNVPPLRVKRSCGESESDPGPVELEVDALKAELSMWKSEYNELFLRYQPYQIQIDSFIEANSDLKGQSELAQSEAVKLGMQYTQLLGHQNKKQKIHHADELAKENIALKRETMRLQDELSNLRRAKRSQEKENVPPLPRTPLVAHNL